MNLLFLFFHCLTLVCGIKSTESAFESRVNEKAGTEYSSNAKADTFNQNQSNWNEKSESGDEKSNWDEQSESEDEKSESGEESKALSRLEIELEELLQSHFDLQFQQRAHQHQEYEPQRGQQQQQYDQQDHQQQQQHGIRLRR